MAAAAAAACEEALAATGQLTEAQFERAMRLFCSWWQRDHPDQAQWCMQSTVLAVTAQVVHYVQLDRVVAAAARSRQAEQPRITALQPTAAAVAAAERPPCSTQHSSSRAKDHTEAGHASAGEPVAGALRAAAAVGPDMQQQELQQVLAGGAGPTAQTSAAGSNHRSSSSSSVGSMPDLDELPTSWDEATSLACGDQGPEGSCAAQQQKQQQLPPPHLHQYSVVWHEIYQVPVLYIGGCHADGRPLTLPELCQDLPQLVEYEDASLAKWAYLTAVAHPVTGGPSFMLHPCQTSARMQLLMQPEGADACTQAAVAAGDAPPSWTAAAVAAAADTPTAHPGPPRQHGCCASGVGSHTARPQLLVYAQGWFSMIVPLLGLSLLSCSPGTEPRGMTC